MASDRKMAAITTASAARNWSAVIVVGPSSFTRGR
jgi:hypothetical protein